MKIHTKFTFLLIFSLTSVFGRYYPAEFDLRFEPDYRKCVFTASEEVNFIKILD